MLLTLVAQRHAALALVKIGKPGLTRISHRIWVHRGVEVVKVV
jgi:hypothetical protein